MKNIYFFTAAFLLSISSFAITITVNSQASFDQALESANIGDTIEWASGTYSNIFMDITTSDITVKAAAIGEVIFDGASRVEIDGNNVIFNGFQYKNGDIGTNQVVRIYGSNNLFTNVNISGYTSYKYLIIEKSSKNSVVSYCNFENRINTPDQNILSILVDTTPGYHTIQYCSFKNFVGDPGVSIGDAGVEPIRIGISTTATLESKSIVEYCYFTECNGDGEIISHKATQCIYRYNTFDNNPNSELVLRHGNAGIVYGNFFTNNMGGVRIQEGSDHIIYNNYFSGLTNRSLNLNASSEDKLDNILVAFNTFIESEFIDSESHSTDEATNVTFANNIFANPSSTNDLFEDVTGTETWSGNIAFGNLGAATASDFTIIDPILTENSKSFYQLSASSPAIDNAVDNTAVFPLPLITDLDYDNEILLDLISETRPATITAKDVGAQEYNASAEVMPYVDADNTGPIYLMPGYIPLSNEDFITSLGSDVKIYPNPLSGNEININFNFKSVFTVEIQLYGITGQKNETLLNEIFNSGPHNILQPVSISTGLYLLQINVKDSLGNLKASKIEKFIKL